MYSREKFLKKRIGILTGGGDCPGLNAVIRAAVKTAILQYRYEVTGKRIVEATDVSVLNPTSTPTITLLTCWPAGTKGTT